MICLYSDMRVSVIRSMGTIIHLDVETDATVGIVKALIQERHGIPLEAQYLMFGGPPLVNNHKLVDLNIKENSRLSLLDRRVLHIVVQISGANTIAVTAEASHTAGDLMKNIERKAGIPANSQIIVFGQQLLEADQTLEEYAVRDGSTVCVYRVCPWYLSGLPPPMRPPRLSF